MPIDTELGGIGSERLGHDLPSVACQAAIELDNLILGRGTSLPSVAELSNRLTEEVPNVQDLNSPLSLPRSTVPSPAPRRRMFPRRRQLSCCP